ncbi:hypothetical protein FSP39_008443 [Pinctada imbricata]|uniref:DZIP3-like HEPN domain-containing protein n=1 Tax=Pinctada imbricata TaxID=66713 RepID=A0AA88Y746_PINIB|nr:hypothetical protein FSP39_008443 [Pinctada imbricata]
MDVTLCCLIIQNICKGINMAHIETIRDVRNKLAHATNAYLDYPTYDDYWNRVKPALIDLGSNVSIKVKEEAREKVDNLAKQDMSTKELEEVKKSIDEVKKEFSEKVSELEETFTEKVTKVEEDLSLTSEKVTQIEENMSQASAKNEEGINTNFERVTQLQIEVGQMQSQIDALSENQTQNQAVREDTKREITALTIEHQIEHRRTPSKLEVGPGAREE